MSAESRRLSVIVFTDIVGYSRMVQADETTALALLGEHNQIVAPRIEAHRGRTIKTIGDAFMAAFDSAADAVAAAAEIQQALTERNAGVDAERQVHVRIGIHAGDVVFTTGTAGGADALGDGVNVASRVEAEAGADQIFVSHDVFSITYERVPFGYKDIGVRELKNISRPIHIYELLWDPARADEADAQPPRSVAPPAKGGRIGWIFGAIAVVAAVAVIVFNSAPTTQDLGVRGGRPSLAVVGIADHTGDAELARVQIGRILTDAVEKKFYEYRPVHLVSPLRLGRVRRELGVSYEDLGNDDGLVVEVASAAGGRLVISGRLRKRGDGFQLSAELNDLAGEGELLSQLDVTAASQERLLALVDEVCVQFQQRLVDVLGVGTNEDIVLAPVGELTTHSLEAYDHFRQGHDLYHGGRILEGARELARATEIDSTFALAASDAACAFSFAKDHEQEAIYFALAQRQADDRLRTGLSKAALIFQGNDAWLDGRPAEAHERYSMITQLYPDDPDGFYYLGLSHQYLRAGAADADRDAELRQAIELYEKAVDRHPGYFPIYYDWAMTIQALEGPASAASFLGDYLRQYGDGPGGDSARQTLAEVRGA